MKKIHISNIIAAVIFSVTAAGCGKSFLDAPPQNVLPRESYVKDLKTCEQLMLGLYPMLSSGYGTYTDIYPELAADNIKPVTGSSNFLRMYSWTQISDDKTAEPGASSLNINGLSYVFYKLIVNSNYVIEKTSEFAQEDPAKADKVLGVALTFRAYSYFMLVNLFAQPYNFTADARHLGVVYTSSSNIYAPTNGRATVAEVYQHILEDLERASKLLPENSDNLMLINRKLAVALLSKIYLYKGDYESALRQAQVSMEKTPLLTIANGYPDEIFRKTNPSQNESFFLLVPMASKTLGYSIGGLFSNLYYQLVTQFVATADVAGIITEDSQDVRTKWVTTSSSGWKVNKYAGGAVSDVNPASLSYFKPLIRCSEMYLNAAEACFHLQKEDSAKHYLNLIIQRANPAAAPVQLTGDQLRDAIRKERRKELAFEGDRLFDVLRWKQDIIRTDPAVPEASRLSYPNEKAVPPLPLQDVARPGVIQNPGY
ncbi:RagB/SusD family nutrient uptake outer membrane protein [Chitinophaga sp. 22620]|uniref:RagB/SusD family nutrient uptake outer membrane protein n=1 Tax=Chitinophaga sp. 22620 TaxID=3453952 RepID=UPI003F82E9DD